MLRILPIVLISMVLWAFPYCLLTAALGRALVAAAVSRWRVRLGPAARAALEGGSGALSGTA